MIGQLEALRDLLTDALADATCEASVYLTAGQPAAPSEEGIECQTVVYVWGSEVTDENQLNETACAVASRWAMQIQIWTCYPEDWHDQIRTDDAEDAAACLYELMELVWCALVSAKDSSYFCDCKFVELVPLTVQPRSGGAVSALGGITLPFLCPVPAADSPTSP